MAVDPNPCSVSRDAAVAPGVEIDVGEGGGREAPSETRPERERGRFFEAVTEYRSKRKLQAKKPSLINGMAILYIIYRNAGKYVG